MEFHRAPRRRPLVNMTNMVDVMMLLLIFFVVSTTFIYRPAIPIDLSESEHLSAVRTGSVLVSIDRQGKLYLDAAPMSLAELQSALSERLKSMQDKRVVIEADRNVPYGAVVQAVDAVVGSGARHVRLPAIKKNPEN